MIMMCEICNTEMPAARGNTVRYTCSTACSAERHKRKCNARERAKWEARKIVKAGKESMSKSAEVRKVLEKAFIKCHVFIPATEPVLQTVKCPGCEKEREMVAPPSKIKLRIFCNTCRDKKYYQSKHGYGVAL
jgi:hypothetical protein